MNAIFKGPRLKIKRANQHILNLTQVLNAFVKTNFYRLWVETDADSGKHFLRFQMISEAPCETPLIIGDAIHNLRSALDLAFCEMVTIVGGTPTDFTRFIFRKDRDDLISALNGGPMKAAPDIINFISDVIKPYPTENGPLYALHSLDIADKHLLLLPVFSVAYLTHVNVRIVDKNGNVLAEIIDGHIGVGQGGILNAFSTGPRGKFELKENFQPAFTITFGKGQALEGQPVIPTLHQLAQLVSGILNALENALRARDSAP